jgi:hypothetical protein
MDLRCGAGVCRLTCGACRVARGGSPSMQPQVLSMTNRGPAGEGHYPEQAGERRPPYWQSVRSSEENAAYEAIYSMRPNNLSVYHLLMEQTSHVVVLGEAPPRRCDCLRTLD